MATRNIVTSQPVLSCDICARRLLRGEEHSVFLQAGQRRTVCELCAPRAAQEGWLRERGLDLEALPAARQRPARGLFQRLRRGAVVQELAPQASAPEQRRASRAAGAARRRPSAAGMPDGEGADAQEGAHAVFLPEAATATGLPERAVLAFNESEFPRRVRGLARSLGEPAVNVRAAEHLDEAVRIVIAWELCWYRYEIDFSEDQPAMRALEQGTELAQLAREERVANATLAEDGSLCSPALA